MRWSFSCPRHWGGSQLCCTLTSQGSLRRIRTPSPGPTQRLARSVSVGPGVHVSKERPTMPGPGGGLWCRGPSHTLDSWGAHVEREPCSPRYRAERCPVSLLPGLPVVLPHGGRPAGQPGLYLPEQSSLRALTAGPPAGSSCPLCTGTALPFSRARLLSLPESQWALFPDFCLCPRGQGQPGPHLVCLSQRR